MANDRVEIVGQHYRWHETSREIEDIRDRSRRPDSSYLAKVDVYEDRVKGWFLDIAHGHIAAGQAPGDYVALSVALQYVEGVEQYRRGRPTPDRESGEWFKASAQRLFPTANPDSIKRLWTAVRNGLFHSGFTKGPTLLSHEYLHAMAVSEGYLRINPARFIDTVVDDFEHYVAALRDEPESELATHFEALWDEVWKRT